VPIYSKRIAPPHDDGIVGVGRRTASLPAKDVAWPTNARTKHGELYASYKLYAERSSEKAMTSTQLGKELQALKYAAERTKAARFVIGLKLRPFDPGGAARRVLPPPPY
jgi:hypothetical protein